MVTTSADAEAGGEASGGGGEEAVPPNDIPATSDMSSMLFIASAPGMSVRAPGAAAGLTFVHRFAVS